MTNNQQKDSSEIYWSKLINRIERAVGWFMLISGVLILVVYILYSLILTLLEDVQVDFLTKLSLFLILFGLVILIFSVVREKITINRKEKYSEIDQ